MVRIRQLGSIAKWLVGGVAAVALVGFLLRPAHSEPVPANIYTKTLPEATVALIDPESGSSSGGGTGDVKLSVGDIVLFTMYFAGVPELQPRGVQSYLTDYIPQGTEVVGLRYVDENGWTLEPNRAGQISMYCNGGCSVALPCQVGSPGCVAGTRTLNEGTLAQVYADTGLFFSEALLTDRTPVDEFIQFTNGILMTVFNGTQLNKLDDLIGTAPPYYAHNDWDYDQVQSFANFAGGRTPFGYGSPVAGPHTFFPYEVTEVAGTRYYNNAYGPWNRIHYPGSQLGTGTPGVYVNAPGRVSIPYESGTYPPTPAIWDLRPANPLPVTTTAVRAAAGELRVGKATAVEIALRVLSTPIDPRYGTAGGNVNCAETWGGDQSGAGGDSNPWAFYLNAPNCAFLNLLFTMDVDKPLAVSPEVVTFTVVAKNLSLLDQTSSVIELKVASGMTPTVGGFTPPYHSTVAGCATGFNCYYWNPGAVAGTLEPSEEYTITASFSVPAAGSRSAPVFANFNSDNLRTPTYTKGYTVLTPVVVKGVAIIEVSVDPNDSAILPNGNLAMTGRVKNVGTALGTLGDLVFVLPAGWTLSGNPILNGVAITGCTGTGTVTCGGVNRSMPAGADYAFSFTIHAPLGATTGLYDLAFQLFTSQPAFGGTQEGLFPKAARVSVTWPRATIPSLACPINSSVPIISGTSTEPAGSIVHVFFNGIERGTATVQVGGTWSLDVTTTNFGELYGGLEVRVSQDVPGAKTQSRKGPPCFVSTTRACSDGIDNDSDGLIDFPADPGCESPLDTDETDGVTPQCSDGLDNDSDGYIDFPADPSCPGPDGNDEGATNVCSDGIDNDGDGLIDALDPGCQNGGWNEIPLTVCYNGRDDDSDLVTDFPSDPGCHSSSDDDETNFPFPDQPIKPRLLVVFDTSGSMNWYPENSNFTGSDGTLECNLGHGTESRMYKVKSGVRQGIANFGNVDWALMRYHQRPMAFACPGSNASLQSGGWQGGGAAPCEGFDFGDLLVGFSPDNTSDIVDWMDGESNYAITDPALIPKGFDRELRGSGTTPIAGTLYSALDYLEDFKLLDAPITIPCRSYSVILVTDGAESCGGVPTDAAAALLAAGIKTYVIGFATPDQDVIDGLNAIAVAGGTGTAVFADDDVELSTAIADIVSLSIKVELCDGLDNDCDTEVDEDWPELGVACDNGLLGECRRVGAFVCGDLYSSVCSVANDLPTPVQEICGNGLDDNCDGQVDEGCCYGPEVCNGRDDYCGRSADYYGVYDDGYEDPRIWDLGTHTRLSCGTDEGVCVAGTMWCIGGVVSCEGDTGPAGAETCDGDDENCDGVVDEGLLQRCYTYALGCVVDAGQPSGYDCQGICMPGYQSCVVGGSGVWGTCEGQVGPGTEVCNGVDDNCDGFTDEGLNVSVTCGLGVCERTVESCPAGSPIQCVPGDPTAGGEYHAGCLDLAHNFCCDTLDQNCNGVVNDGVLPKACQSQTNVGGNYCAGNEYCDEGGSWVNCDAPEPIAEDCNNRDDDCDGSIDNVVNTTDPLSQTCYSGLPSQLGLPNALCKEGLRTCSAGLWSACEGQILPSPELCDTIDNDCDGTVNEGLTRQCLVSNQYGACQGTESCNTSGVWVSCNAQTPAPETCNGIDDNCNTRIDEGVNRTCYPVGQPGCVEQPPGSGTWVCQGVCGTGLEACVEGGMGTWTGSCVGADLPSEPVNEASCDGLDNDCDGTTDEGISQACYSHASGCTFDGSTWTCQGVCHTGTQNCVVGGAGTWTSCLDDFGPSQEVCDATDNDCNGTIDDGIPPQGCSQTADVNGVSRTCTGTETCQLGSWVGCTAPLPVAEICDNKDNDCNGAVDDGIAPQTCERSAVIGGQTFTCTGQEICSLGTWIGCNAPTPSAEVCDGVDNDCDGFVDNAVPGQALPLLSEACYNGDPATLGVGTCHAGTRTCTGGTFGLCVNQQLPEVEVCDGLDNDCDGYSDNAVQGQALPLLSQACQSTSAFGVCLGQQVCTGDPGNPWTACDAQVATEEVCDGVDNNCDGVIDGVSEACYSFMAEGGCSGDPVNGFQCEGICHAGLRTCPVLAAPNPGGNTFGICQFEAGPSEEVCDGLDNDCDGFIDEDETNSASPMSRVCYQPGYGTNTGCDALGSCTGICQEGTQTCGDLIAGQWGGCVGEVTPGLEVCDALDNDCDGDVDEETDMPWLGQPCTQDATGNPICNGIWVCEDGVETCSGGAVEPGLCDGLDNDCDGAIDELDELQQDPVFETACGTDLGECAQGTFECIGGAWACVGEQLPSEEVCDGLDNNCDTLIDNGADCARVGGRDAYCVEADCRLVCDPTSEMPCQPGFECVEKPTEQGNRFVCMPIVGNCGGQTCPTGWICENEVCVDPCADVTCESWEQCRMGFCVDVSCTAPGRDCPGGEICVDHACVEDPCEDSSCFDEGGYCVRECDGADCTSRCEPLCVCDGNAYCDASGSCVEDSCHGVTCSPNQRCDRQTGLCEADPCFNFTCLNQTVCFEGACIDDPCAAVACPWPYECAVQPGVDDQGNPIPVVGCERDPALWVDGDLGDQYLATGGGGCQCNAPGAQDGDGAAALWLLLLGWLYRRRRQATRRSVGGAR